MSSSFKRCVVIVALFACTLVVHGQQPQTVQQGVYTAGQATRGQAIYKEKCASCHDESLGGGLGPPLAGDFFVEDWNKQPLSELVSKIQNTMPANDPGKLTPQQTTDIVSYMLQVGKFPAGRTELRPDEAVLKQITWPAAAAQPTPVLAASHVPTFPPAGNLSQVMRGILFPSSNIIFTVQTHDPAERRTPVEGADTAGGFNWTIWGGDIYSGWELVDYAGIAIAESAPLMLTPGRRCENGRPVPVNDPEWIKFTEELAAAGRAAYKASQTRKQEVVGDFSNVLNDSCFNCHQVYRDKNQNVRDPKDPSNKAARCTK